MWRKGRTELDEREGTMESYPQDIEYQGDPANEGNLILEAVKKHLSCSLR